MTLATALVGSAGPAPAEPTSSLNVVLHVCDGHSATGLMRAEWDAKDLRLAVDGRLTFTSEQAELIRGRLRARVADTQAAR